MHFITSILTHGLIPLATTPCPRYLLFTSIPVPRILAAVDALLQDYYALNSHFASESTISVDLKQTDSHLPLFRGRLQRASKQPALLRRGDILPLCQLSLNASIFTQMGRCFQQVRGSAIGNQISPVLATITVSYTEQKWLQQLPRPLPPTLFTCRYVDNRPTFLNSNDAHRSHITPLLQPTFYEEPVLLEDEPDNSFLGCVTHPTRLTLTYQQPTALWQFHAWASASAPRRKLSAAYARLRLATQHTYRLTQAKADVDTLISKYVELGYTLRHHCSNLLDEHWPNAPRDPVTLGF